MTTKEENRKQAIDKIMIKWHAAVCEAQGSPKGPKLMIKGIKEAQGRLREAQGTEKALKGTTSVLEAGLTPTYQLSHHATIMYPKNLTSELMQLQLLQVGLKRMEHVLWMTIIGILDHNMLQKPVKSGLF